MSIFTPVTLEEEEEVIKDIFKMIDDRNAHVAALLIIRAGKPVSLLGGMLFRFLLGPVIPLLGHREEKWIWTLQMPENLEKLEKMLEEAK
ncbi:MAG: hypothetical protein NWE89_02940 [Candidatus Bathyarchaeota archaeon]|nr:hypothetical protein [Candidatus Bathyarchaeota archaeon]